MTKKTDSYRNINYWYEPNPHGEGWRYQSDTSNDETIAYECGTQEELIIWIHTLICWRQGVPVWSRSTDGDWVLEENGRIHARSNERRIYDESQPFHILPEHSDYERMKVLPPNH